MFCRSCGKELIGTPEFCLECGARPTAGGAFCLACGTTTTPMTGICIRCGARVAGQTNNALPVLAHILGLFTSWLGPLIILLATGEERIKNHARMALNWQLSFIIYSIVPCSILAFALITLAGGIVLLFVPAVLDVVFCIMAAVKASRGELSKYPLTIPFLKAKPDSSGTVVQ